MDNIVEEVRKKTDIVDLISEYIPLIKKGKNYFGVCPFHDDSNPSMSVSREKQIYKCFSCGASGNIYNFLMDYEHIDFKEALSKLSSKLGINIENTTIKVNNKFDKFYEIYDLTSKLYQNNLLSEKGSSARNYLKSRNISLEEIKKLNPTLIVPLIQKKHLNGILILQERLTFEENQVYTEYEQQQIMGIAALAAVAINNAVLIEMSSTDMMTHLKLKYYFFNLLTQAIDSAFLNNQNIAVLMFDIDFFKNFNDTYGHECGDMVLIDVAEIIKNSLREADIASRYGGEEFTVLLYDSGKKEAMIVSERIRSAIEKHDFLYNNQHLHVTISCGVSVFDAEKNLVNSPNEFVNQADQALYISKNEGRNKVTYFEPKKKK